MDNISISSFHVPFFDGRFEYNRRFFVMFYSNTKSASSEREMLLVKADELIDMTNEIKEQANKLI